MRQNIIVSYSKDQTIRTYSVLRPILIKQNLLLNNANSTLNKPNPLRLLTKRQINKWNS
ncbi:hypothetical protein LEP1GSC150_0433 [Leptospira interrogans serovar Copenhageni str. LT2050]|uniref:Uncharacterized protein n=1 Tax=Leptospira interrogans serovar Copenhageni str. LT2050 TaxID=1001598 RepID=M3G381_LEPIT|nr:hypothetical protein LEP1GSC150_0433 [Leptospira interrogans serovar Copenhageni str. LT2050]